MKIEQLSRLYKMTQENKKKNKKGGTCQRCYKIVKEWNVPNCRHCNSSFEICRTCINTGTAGKCPNCQTSFAVKKTTTKKEVTRCDARVCTFITTFILSVILIVLTGVNIHTRYKNRTRGGDNMDADIVVFWVSTAIYIAASFLTTIDYFFCGDCYRANQHELDQRTCSTYIKDVQKVYFAIQVYQISIYTGYNIVYYLTLGSPAEATTSFWCLFLLATAIILFGNVIIISLQHCCITDTVDVVTFDIESAPIVQSIQIGYESTAPAPVQPKMTT
jgi:hypothetical protein